MYPKNIFVKKYNYLELIALTKEQMFLGFAGG